jgi:hypothetical protein
MAVVSCETNEPFMMPIDSSFISMKRPNKKLPDIGSGGIKPHHESHHHDHDVNK